MAINSQDKKGLLQQILGEADITVTTSGIAISGIRLSTPRFIPFDESGRCRSCKGTEVEVDTMVTKEGITIWCTRMSKVQFVPFDIVYDLPAHCFFRVKNKARVFNIPYGDVPVISCLSQESHTENLNARRKANTAIDLMEVGLMGDALHKEEVQATELKRKAKVALDLVEAGLFADAMQDEKRWKKAKTALTVLGNLLLADSLYPPAEEKKEDLKNEIPSHLLSPHPPQPPPVELYSPPRSVEVIPPPPPPVHPKEDNDDKVLQEFYDSISAATTMMDTKPMPKRKSSSIAKNKNNDKVAEEFYQSVQAATTNL